MRFRPLARRIALAPALALALALTAAACSSSSTSPAATSSSSTPASSSAPATSASAGTSTGGNSAAVAEITANWEKFFDSSTPVSEKTQLLQNGSTFSAAISGLMSLVSGLGAKVTHVTVNTPTSATVTYNLTTKGSTLLSNQTGKAVYVNGVWKVGDTSLCGLLKLVPGGSLPAACSSAG
jgi:purine-cytosine permease-like protein